MGRLASCPFLFYSISLSESSITNWDDVSGAQRGVYKKTSGISPAYFTCTRIFKPCRVIHTDWLDPGDNSHAALIHAFQ
jgi:hypothetical protein